MGASCLQEYICIMSDCFVLSVPNPVLQAMSHVSFISSPELPPELLWSLGPTRSFNVLCQA